MAKLGKFNFPVSGRRHASQNSSVAEADNHIPKALRILGVDADNLNIELKRNAWSYKNYESNLPMSRSSSSVPSLNDSQEILCHENFSKVRGKASSVLGLDQQQRDEVASRSNSARSSCENSSLASKSSYRLQWLPRNTSHSTSNLSGFDFDLKPASPQMVFASPLTHNARCSEPKKPTNSADPSSRNIQSSSTPILAQKSLDLRNNYCYPDKDDNGNYKSSSLAIDAEKRIEAARRIEGAFSGYREPPIRSSIKEPRSNDSDCNSYKSSKNHLEDELSTRLAFDSIARARSPEDWMEISILAFATDSDDDESDGMRTSTSSKKNSHSDKITDPMSQIAVASEEVSNTKVCELSEVKTVEVGNRSHGEQTSSRRHSSTASLEFIRISTHSNRFAVVTEAEAARLQDLRLREFLGETQGNDSPGPEEFSASPPPSPRYLRQSLISNFSQEDDEVSCSKFYSPHSARESSPEALSSWDSQTCSPNLISRFALQSNEARNSDPRLSTLSSSSVLVEFARIGRVVRCGRPQSKIRTRNTQRRNET